MTTAPTPIKPGVLTPLTTVELARIATDLQTLVGAQLQDAMLTETAVGLSFYHRGQTIWLWFDLHPMRPMVVRIDQSVDKARDKILSQRKKVTRPLLLFLRSRFFGRRLEAARADLVRGRILVLTFARGADEKTPAPCEIEVRLFPHGQNIIARDGKASVADQKPKDLPLSVAPMPGDMESEGRTWEEIEAHWRLLQTSQASGASKGPATDAQTAEKEWKKTIEKKRKAIIRMEEELREKTSTVFGELGEWLKANGSIEVPTEMSKDVPQEWRGHLDLSKSLSWNIEHVFHRAKENRRKAEGTRARLLQVQAEIEALEKAGPIKSARAAAAKGPDDNLLARADAKGRRHKIADDLEAYIGKSAADNLALLRRAQPFDYWLHLRERPGSHAIMRRTRTRHVTDAEFAEAGRWVVEQSLNKRIAELKGERFDLLIVECRFVRPIKGDKLGRVNYTNDRVMPLKF